MINIPKLFPIVQQTFPVASKEVIMQKMTEFAQKHPDYNDQMALQAFQQAMQHPKVKNSLQSYLKRR